MRQAGALATSERSRPQARSEVAKEQEAAQTCTVTGPNRGACSNKLGVVAFHGADYRQRIGKGKREIAEALWNGVNFRLSLRWPRAFRVCRDPILNPSGQLWR